MPKKSAKPAAAKSAKKTAKKGGAMAEGEGYCVKCKAKRVMANVKQVKMANGRPALKGTCPVCGTGMFKILPPS
jgi:DNA-directed RNA polymerase subunit M/transcription elongation factor TFIIS